MSKLLCYICFSRAHPFKDCIYAMPNYFLPSIDQDLFPRFIELFAIEEKLFLVFSYPKIFAAVKKKPFKVMRRKSITFCNLKNNLILNSDLLIADTAEVQNSFFSSLTSKIAFRIECLEITLAHHLSMQLSSNELFLLLTFKTKILRCINVEFYPKVTFHQVVEAAPALEVINIYETNILVDNTWVDLLNGLQNLKTVYLAIPNFNFDVANLAVLTKKKKKKKEKTIQITLYTIVSKDKTAFNKKEAFESIRKQLISHFFKSQIGANGCPLAVCFKYDSGYSECFNFKMWQH